MYRFCVAKIVFCVSDTLRFICKHQVMWYLSCYLKYFFRTQEGKFDKIELLLLDFCKRGSNKSLNFLKKNIETDAFFMVQYFHDLIPKA